MANPEAAAAELAEHYARILGQQVDRRVPDVVRTCLCRLPSRLPIQGEDLRAVEELMERVLRLGEVGARDPIGSPREIDDYIAHRLGEPASGPRRVYRALRAMVGHTVLVDRRSRQIWVLCLSGVLDSSSILHRAFLAETPALYSLPPSDTDSVATSKALRRATDDPITPSQPLAPLADPSQELRAELAQLHEELAAQRLARVEADKRREAADAALDEEKRARGEADQRVQVVSARLTALEREFGTQHRALEQERRAREEADLLVQAAAAHRATLEQDLDLLRYALDEERLARGEADRRGQDVEAELVAMQDARAADVATMRRLIESDQAIAAAAFLIARMHGVNHEDAIKAVHPLIPAAAAGLLTARDQTPEADPTGGTPAAPAAVGTTPLWPADPTNGAPGRTSDTPTLGPHRDALQSALLPASPNTDPVASSRKPPLQRPRASRGPGFLASGTEPDQLPRQLNKVGRNDPCPCGSGTKFKRCCGRSA